MQKERQIVDNRLYEDQAVLLLYAFTALLYTAPDVIFLTGLLGTVIYITANSSPRSFACRGILAVLFLSAIFFYPRLFCFLPVLSYNLLLYKDRTGSVLLLLLCLYHAHLGDLIPLLAQIPGCAAAFLLSRRTSQICSLRERYHQTRDDSRELNLLLREKNQMLLKNQDNEIYTATLKERNRIAREIHDHVGHMLSCSILMTGALRTINADPNLSASLEQLENTLHAAMDNIRQSVHDLHDTSIDLRDTLEQLSAAHTSCPVSLEYDMGSQIPSDVKCSLIAIVKEGLHNIAKHSNADRAVITLREHPGLYQLCIKDNGTFEKTSSVSGMGLCNIQDRAHALGGSMQIYRDGGFQIFITIPKERNTTL